jgi:hypothetical protein
VAPVFEDRAGETSALAAGAGQRSRDHTVLVMCALGVQLSLALERVEGGVEVAHLDGGRLRLLGLQR